MPHAAQHLRAAELPPSVPPEHLQALHLTEQHRTCSCRRKQQVGQRHVKRQRGRRATRYSLGDHRIVSGQNHYLNFNLIAKVKSCSGSSLLFVLTKDRLIRVRYIVTNQAWAYVYSQVLNRYKAET